MPKTVVCLCLCLGSVVTSGAEFYVDPENGSMQGDGSAQHPWQSIQAVVDAGLIETQSWEQLPYKQGVQLKARHVGAPIQGGDTIWLRSGYHGDLYIDKHYNAKSITLAAEEGHEPRLSGLHIRASSHWVVKGLSISAEFAEPFKRRTLVQLRSHGWHGPVHDVTVEDCAVSSVADTTSWSVQDWNTRACNGFQVDGTRMTIQNNQVLNVNFGISVEASHSLIRHNEVKNFSGDGLRGLGDYSTFEYNTVKNCYNVNANHDDGFQSWSVGPKGVGSGEVKGIVLRGNTIINREDPDQPHPGALQGIGCFDGTFVDWVVENNVVIVDHWHGITLLGARDCRIANNTVRDQKEGTPGPPWIKIGRHKNGTAPEQCEIRHNRAVVSAAPGVAQENNRPVQGPSALVPRAGQWRGLHLLNYGSDAALQSLAEQVPALAQAGINVLILEVNYGFSYESHPELRMGEKPITRDGAAQFAKTCRGLGIHLVPQFNCLGHQSWAKTTYTFLTKYPELDLTPGAFPENEGIYCREWDPLNPRVNEIIFPMLDELINAFDARALHVGMDEVFLIGSEHSPTTKGRDPAPILAKAINDLHTHLVKKRGVDMLMWGDRLIDGHVYRYGDWESATNGTAPAIDLIPKDIIICDWHYKLRDSYLSVPMFAEKGFRVWPAGWKEVDGTKALITYSRDLKHPNMLGHLFTTWSGHKQWTEWPPIVEGLKILTQEKNAASQESPNTDGN